MSDTAFQFCKNCRFFRPNYNKPGGACRRSAPERVTYIHFDRDADLPVAYGLWPIIDDDDWCGDWEAGRQKL